jgi:hypothetical protein
MVSLSIDSCVMRKLLSSSFLMPYVPFRFDQLGVLELGLM